MTWELTNSTVFATGNANKLKEVNAILELYDIKVESRELDIVEVQGTTKDVSSAKCRQAANLIGGPVITEDTALAFHAMNGLPGPYIKDFMKNLGHAGLNAMLAGFPNKGATAICTFAYSAGPGLEPILFEGLVEGEIVPARGSPHFGWDAVFQAAGTGQTFAEMDDKFKNSISHRYRALSKLVDYLKENPEGLQGS